MHILNRMELKVLIMVLNLIIIYQKKNSKLIRPMNTFGYVLTPQLVTPHSLSIISRK